MKVKELISRLQKLDPERNVWIFYDYPVACYEPDFSYEATESDAQVFKRSGCKAGDYICDVG